MSSLSLQRVLVELFLVGARFSLQGVLNVGLGEICCGSRHEKQFNESAVVMLTGVL